MRHALPLVLAIGLATGCRPTDAADDQPAADAGVDAVDGVGCTALSPRSVPPETFIGPTGLQPRLTALIDSAQQSLDVQMYLFTVSGLADRIVAAHQRGVAVRVILDPDHAGNPTTRGKLTSAGVPNRNAPAIYSFSHAKYLLIDRKDAVIMSMNFNADAMSNERNFGMITRDPEDVADVQAIFDMDWAGGGGEPPNPADLACTRLIVSPNNAKTRLVQLIDSAMATLEIQALYISETAVRSAVLSAKQRGVNVRVIFEGSMDNADTKAMFTAAGITFHDATTFYLHSKLIVADGVVFVGSENFSLTALTKNREVGALVFEPGPAMVIRQQFETDWSSTQ